MILPIVAYGDPVLKKVAENIDASYPELSNLVADMFETMYHAKGVGLAAPQIGRSIRLFVVDGAPFADEEGEEPDPKAKGIENFKKVFLNPTIIEESGQKWAFQEGCLSIPGVREKVYRHEKVTINYFDENWKENTETFDGYAARIIQHEYDHLEGILFTELVTPLKKKLIAKKLTNISIGNVRADYKMKFFDIKRGR
ncbi:MAG: hypothetical protein RL264_2105 [Bacteroidota bacterium]|jgi:peptide deformylase